MSSRTRGAAAPLCQLFLANLLQQSIFPDFVTFVLNYPATHSHVFDCECKVRIHIAGFDALRNIPYTEYEVTFSTQASLGARALVGIWCCERTQIFAI